MKSLIQSRNQCINKHPAYEISSAFEGAHIYWRKYIQQSDHNFQGADRNTKQGSICNMILLVIELETLTNAQWVHTYESITFD